MRKTLEDLEREIEEDSNKAGEKDLGNLSPEASASIEGEMRTLKEVVVQEAVVESKKQDAKLMDAPAIEAHLSVVEAGRSLWSSESVKATILGVIVSLLTAIIATRF